MPDCTRVDSPAAPPTHCVWCNTHSDRQGFIDTGREIPGYGRIYICVTSCGNSVARAIGWASPEKQAATEETVSELRAELAQTQASLEEEKLNKVVPLAEVVDFFQAYEKKHGHKVGAKPKAAA